MGAPLNGLTDFLRQYIDIPEGLTDTIGDIAHYKTFEKNELIFSPHAVCQHIYLLTKGLVRCFYLYDDKEINLRLLCENSAVIAYSSYIEQTRTEEYVQAVEACEGYLISRHDLERVAAQLPAIEQLKRLTAERHYLSMERRLLTIQFKTAEERLRYFNAHMEPGIVARTPAVHVASYLGMTPESLSRAKRHLNK